MRKGDLTEEDQNRLMHAARSINQFSHRLAIDETPAITLSELRSRCRRYHKEHGLDLVIIDYLQLMGSNSRGDNREREVSEISAGLKALAKELAIPVIALAQLNRGADARTDKRPKISDLRESGSIEQDADQILFVYRDEYYNPNSELTGKSEIIIGKNRHGETGTVYLAFLPNFVSFHNLIREN
jgi:replicative DNA helicase